jgi:hypothetical protein
MKGKRNSTGKSWLDLIVEALQEDGSPMKSSEIAASIFNTHANCFRAAGVSFVAVRQSVSVALCTAGKRGKEKRFVRAEYGRYYCLTTSGLAGRKDGE